jgi:hypothetical protein
VLGDAADAGPAVERTPRARAALHLHHRLIIMSHYIAMHRINVELIDQHAEQVLFRSFLLKAAVDSWLPTCVSSQASPSAAA